MFQLAIANNGLLHLLGVASQPLLLLLLFTVLIFREVRHRQRILIQKRQFDEIQLRSDLQTREQTLDHVAKELHAGCGNLVSLINIHLSAVLSECPPEMREDILSAKQLNRQLLSELRDISAALNTDHIKHIGFQKAMEKELARFERAGKCLVGFSVSGQPYRLNPEHELTLFRLCQEILDNILKYAEAKLITIGLKYSPDLFVLNIRDDGIGFDSAAALKDSGEKNSTGLINIQRRAQLINAGLTIESRQGEGTSFIINIPQPETPKLMTYG